MPKVSEEHRAARRRQILDAAARCFARDGFHRTSMQDIVRESGISAGLVYRYFAGMTALSGALSASGTFALVPTNSAPEGIADPLTPSVLTSEGTDFWLAFPGNYERPEAGEVGFPTALSLHISGNAVGAGTVQIPGLGFSTTFNGSPGAKLVRPMISILSSSCTLS